MELLPATLAFYAGASTRSPGRSVALRCVATGLDSRLRDGRGGAGPAGGRIHPRPGPRGTRGPGEVGGDADLAVRDGMKGAVGVPQGRPSKREVLHHARYPGDADHVAPRKLVLDEDAHPVEAVSYTHLRAHETDS